MILKIRNDFGQLLRPWQPIQSLCSELRQAALPHLLVPLNAHLDRLRLWRERLSPSLRRAGSAGQLLFQVVGAAGYAGYFVSMHTLMRVFSGALMAGAWYAIYRIKGAVPP